jgi:hypothetical protein
MKYHEISLEVNAPTDFVFNFLSLHKNFEKINVASSRYKCEFLDKDLLNNGGSVKAGVVYNLKAEGKSFIFYLGCLTLVVEKNRLIKYRYIYTGIGEPPEEGSSSNEETAEILDTLNAAPFEGSWIFKNRGPSKTQLKILMETNVNGQMSFFIKWYTWFSSKLPSKDKKETIRIFEVIKAQIEAEYQSQ